MLLYVWPTRPMTSLLYDVRNSTAWKCCGECVFILSGHMPVTSDWSSTRKAGNWAVWPARPMTSPIGKLGIGLSNSNDVRIYFRHITLETAVYSELQSTWKDSGIMIDLKLQLLMTTVFPVLLYAAETWTVNKEDEKRLPAFEMRCYRCTVAVKWQDRRTNEEIRAVVQRKQTVMDTIRITKLQLFGHICRMPDDRLLDIIVWNGRGWASSSTTSTKIDWWHFKWCGKDLRCGINNRRQNQKETIRDRLYGPCWPWDQKKKSPNEWRHQFTRKTSRQYCVKKHLIFVILFSLPVRR